MLLLGDGAKTSIYQEKGMLHVFIMNGAKLIYSINILSPFVCHATKAQKSHQFTKCRV